MKKVTVIQGLESEVVELQISLCLEGCAQTSQIKLLQPFIEQFVVHALLDELWKVVHIGCGHVSLRHVPAQDLLGHGMKQETRCRIGVVGVFLNQRASRQNGCFIHLVHGYAVIQIAHGFCEDWCRLDVGAQVGAG